MNIKLKNCTNYKVSGLLTIILLAFSGSQIAEAQVYRWTDDAGRVVVSDTPPPSGKGQKIGKAPESQGMTKESGDGKKAAASLDPEVAKKVKETEKKEKDAEEKRQKEVEAYCGATKERLASLQSGERIQVREKSGERGFMNDQQRAEEINKAKASMAEQKCR